MTKMAKTSSVVDLNPLHALSQFVTTDMLEDA
jgi:hypothetical protein